MGGFGLLLLGLLDSSFLFLPFGNDLLLVAMVSADRGGFKWIYFVVMSAVGSTLGVLLTDIIVRPMGENALERFVRKSRIEKIKPQIEEKGGWAVFTSTLIPPPFPFTAVILSAQALQYSRKKIMLLVFTGRLIRFTGEALLAIYFGRKALEFIGSEVIQYFVYGLILIAIIGSVFTVRRWLGTRSG